MQDWPIEGSARPACKAKPRVGPCSVPYHARGPQTSGAVKFGIASRWVTTRVLLRRANTTARRASFGRGRANRPTLRSNESRAVR
jgi:hypothetical protein